jgi:hypothetical protein
MFNTRFFPASYFAPRYFPELGGVYTGTGQPGHARASVTGAKRAANREVTQ